MRANHIKKRKIKINKKTLISGFAGFCIALCLWIGFAEPNQYLYNSNQAYYDNTNSEMLANNVQDALDELYQCVEDKDNPAPSVTLNVGDMVKMKPVITSYITETKYTGTDSPSTINPIELTLWRVIRVNSDGTYDAVSEYTSSEKVYFSGIVGYQSYIYYLNILASKYENPQFTVDSRYMGYNGQTEFINDTSYFNGSSKKSQTEWKIAPTTTPAEEHLGRGDFLYQVDYDLVKAAYGNANDAVKAYKVGTTEYNDYWLASRIYGYYSLDRFDFFGRHITSEGTIYQFYQPYHGAMKGSMRSFMDIYWQSPNYGFALRPIITLRHDLKATGSGSLANPYVLK